MGVFTNVFHFLRESQVESAFLEQRSLIINGRFVGRNRFWDEQRPSVMLERAVDRPETFDAAPNLDRRPFEEEVSQKPPSNESEWMALLEAGNNDLEFVAAQLESLKNKGEQSMQNMSSTVSDLRERARQLEERIVVASSLSQAMAKLMIEIGRTEEKIKERLADRRSMLLDAAYYVERAERELSAVTAEQARQISKRIPNLSASSTFQPWKEEEIPSSKKEVRARKREKGTLKSRSNIETKHC